MIDAIFNFLTFNGAFISLKDLLINFLNWTITQITNTAYLLIDPLLDKVSLYLPSIDNLVPQVNYIFNYVSSFVNFILDMTFISQPVIIYFALSLIARVSLKNSTYFLKLVTNWYEKLVP